MSKSYRGNIPDEGLGWDEMVGCQDADGVEWLVFRQKQTHDENWWNMKIVADGRAEHKANYWMALNVKTGKLAFDRDFGFMKETRPELHSQIQTLFDKFTKGG